MVRVFKLVLETTTQNFVNWLVSEKDLVSNGNDLKTQEKFDKLLYIGNGRIVPPSSEWPHTLYVADGYMFSMKTGGFPAVW